MSSQVQSAGIPWYKESEDAEIQSVMTDGHNLPVTYAAWLQAAKKVKESFAARGIVPIEAYINPSEFAAWCAARGLNVDAKARIEYASFVAYKSYQQGNA